MAGLQCKCGNILSDAIEGSENIFDVISNKQRRNWFSSNRGIFRFADFADYEVWHCPKCGRNHVIDHNGKKVCVLIKEE